MSILMKLSKKPESLESLDVLNTVYYFFIWRDIQYAKQKKRPARGMFWFDSAPHEWPMKAVDHFYIPEKGHAINKDLLRQLRNVVYSMEFHNG